MKDRNWAHCTSWGGAGGRGEKRVAIVKNISVFSKEDLSNLEKLYRKLIIKVSKFYTLGYTELMRFSCPAYIGFLD